MQDMIGDYGDYLDSLKEFPELREQRVSYFARFVEAKRYATHLKFPHVVTLRGDYPSHDEIEAACWDRFGPRDGPCTHYEFTENVRCEITAKLRQDNPDWFDVAVPDHSHEGVWTTLWLQKTGYDYGYQDYCFSDLADKQRFLTLFNSQGHCLLWNKQ